MKTFLAFAFAILALSAMSCKDAPTGPHGTGSDTTSHNFVWRKFYFGDGSATSDLSDVAIINDSLIYVVGEVYHRDSLGQADPVPYNLIKWDGHTWQLKRASTLFRGNIVTGPLTGICALSPTQIWLAGSLPIYGDGSSWQVYDLRTALDPGLSLSRVWASSPTDVYFVGDAGSFVHFDGAYWTEIWSRTTLSIYDVYGRGSDIIAIASSMTTFEHKVLRLTANSSTVEPDSAIVQDQHSVYVSPSGSHFLCGTGIYEKDDVTRTTPWRRLDNWTPSYFLFSIRGNADNDLFACGSFGEVLHWNGDSWMSYRTTAALSYGEFSGIASKGDIVVCVGIDASLGVIMVGRRLH